MTPTAPISVVAALISRHGRYLLGRRPDDKRHGGLWEFPGGKLDAGESPLAAARRELAEELSLEVLSLGPIVISVRDSGSPFVIDFHEVQVRGEPAAHEHSALGWFTPQQMASLPLAPADARCARQLAADTAGEEPV